MNLCLLAAAQAAGSPILPKEVLLFLGIGIVIYVAVMLLIGYFSSRRIAGLDDYIVAGRRLPLWMATATLLATWFGAGSSMGVAATTYTDGVGGVLADPFGASVSLILAGIFVVGMLRKMKCLTVTDIIARRYGHAAGAYASLWMLPVYIGWLGSQMLGLGTILYLLTGMNIILGTCIGAVIVLVYTYAGGMWAVTLTDVIQVSLIVLGLLIILPGAVGEAGGFGKLYSSLSAADLNFWIPPAAKGASHTLDDWSYYIGSWIVMGLGCMVGQDLIQRSLASRDEKVAVASSVMSGFFYLIIGLIPITIGFAARIVLPKYGISPEAMGADPENQVLPQMAMIVLGKLHPLLLVLFFSALVSAIMSSADSSLLAGSSLLCNNVLKPLLPQLSDKAFLRLTRISTVVLTLVSLYFALSVKNIYVLMKNSWVTQLVVVFLPVMTAMYVPKASRNAAWAAMIVSTAVWLAYCAVSCIGATGSFAEIMENFDRPLTCGAVYGFASGVLVFFCCCLGERLSEKFRAGEETE
ncbi:MAG: sodium:solute symporter family protein [Lentisphaeria bacterium]|nr:sodium:solute symporter family protein [Lentisphaeria bacterium]